MCEVVKNRDTNNALRYHSLCEHFILKINFLSVRLRLKRDTPVHMNK
jgi:hypothetical protein